MNDHESGHFWYIEISFFIKIKMKIFLNISIRQY